MPWFTNITDGYLVNADRAYERLTENSASPAVLSNYGSPIALSYTADGKLLIDNKS